MKQLSLLEVRRIEGGATGPHDLNIALSVHVPAENVVPMTGLLIGFLTESLDATSFANAILAAQAQFNAMRVLTVAIHPV